MSSNVTNTHDGAPIFIIGAPRSGTSAMTWALGQHPNIQPMPETAWIAASSVGAYLAHRSGSARGKLSHLSNVNYSLERFLAVSGRSIDTVIHEAFVDRCRDLYGENGTPKARQINKHKLFLRRSIDDPKARWVDGTPLNTFYIWALAQMFPDAKFLHNLRSPHAVVASLEKFDRVGAEPMKRKAALNSWSRHTQVAWAAEQALGSDRVHLVDFCRLEHDPESLLNEICAFLGEAPCADCLEPLEFRLNSSQSRELADSIEAKLSKIAIYSAARDLYDTVLNATRPLAGNAPEASDIIRQQFLDLVDGRSLI